MSTSSTIVTLVLILPFLGGLLTYILQRKEAVWVSLLGMLPGLILAIVLATQVVETELVIRWEWLPEYELGWRVDALSALLICLVYLIAILVHLFSSHYLHGDPGIHQYFAKLGFFTSSMLGLLAADHFLLLFGFWELVGFSSYLLIGFWYQDVQKARSAREAFMVNRVADAGLLIGVILMIGELHQPFLSEITGGSSSVLVHLAGFGLLIGALGKSAQFPFLGWLPKAMAGPTPVSALIHAATMVAAGVYLLVRVVPFLTPLVLDVAAVLGALTAFMAAVAALTQFDIKKVLAYSTISQLGYMVMGIGVGAYQASVFHLWTHAFFKAGLFLAAGAVIHYYHTLHHHNAEFDAQDMRTMGGIRKVLPLTFMVFLVCGLALSGLPFFSGFLSKEGILSGAWGWAKHHSEDGFWWAYVVSNLGFVTALLTPVYVGRQLLLVFYGTPRTAIKPLSGMEPVVKVGVPLMVLATGALWFAHALSPFDAQGWWLSNALFGQRDPHFEHGSIAFFTLVISISLAVLGLLISYLLYNPKGSRVHQYGTKELPSTWYGGLSFHAWYIESIYDWISKAFLIMCVLAFRFDKLVIDKLVDTVGVWTVVISKGLAIVDREVVDGLVNLLAWVSKTFGRVLTGIQSGKVQSQLVWLILFFVILLLGFSFS